MKKRILAMLLSALLAANFSACSQTPNNIPENKTEGSVESIVESTTETEESNNELPNQNETVRDVPGLGQLKLFSSCNASTKASIWWSDEKEEFYIYINDWDAYRLMRGLSMREPSSNLVWWYLKDNCIAIDNEATTVSLIYQEGKHHEPIIITYRLHRSNELVEVHAVPLNIKASSEYDTYFVNMHDVNHGYYFLISNMDGDHYWRINEFPGGGCRRSLGMAIVYV